MSDQQSEYTTLIQPVEEQMMRTVWRVTRDPDDAEDAFQEALLTIWRQWDQIRKHPNPHAFILRICLNAAHDLLRRKTRQRKWLDASANLPHLLDHAPSIVQEISAAEESSQVLAAIGSLSKNQAQAILLHTVEEIPYIDVASAMHCREVTVRKHVARARARLRILLSHLIPAVRKEDAHA